MSIIICCAILVTCFKFTSSLSSPLHYVVLPVASGTSLYNSSGTNAASHIKLTAVNIFTFLFLALFRGWGHKISRTVSERKQNGIGRQKGRISIGRLKTCYHYALTCLHLLKARNAMETGCGETFSLYFCHYISNLFFFFLFISKHKGKQSIIQDCMPTIFNFIQFGLAKF